MQKFSRSYESIAFMYATVAALLRRYFRQIFVYF